MLKDKELKNGNVHRWESRMLGLIGYLLKNKFATKSDITKFLDVVPKAVDNYKKNWKFLNPNEMTKKISLKKFSFKIISTRKEIASEKNYLKIKKQTEKKLVELFEFACKEEFRHFEKITKHTKTYVIPYFGFEISIPMRRCNS
jgi:hypothetical protein